jgi:hypothetical protein
VPGKWQSTRERTPKSGPRARSVSVSDREKARRAYAVVQKCWQRALAFDKIGPDVAAAVSFSPDNPYVTLLNRASALHQKLARRVRLT